jgi:hypothetical protein
VLLARLSVILLFSLGRRSHCLRLVLLCVHSVCCAVRTSMCLVLLRARRVSCRHLLICDGLA